MPPTFSGKMHKSAQGMLYLRNFDAMPEAMAEDLLRVVRAIEHKQVVQEKFHRLLPRVLVLGTSKTVDDLQDQRRRGLGELLDEIGEELTIPPLNERLDLDYVIRSVTHDIDAEKIIVEAERYSLSTIGSRVSAGCARPCARSSATARVHPYGPSGRFSSSD